MFFVVVYVGPTIAFQPHSSFIKLTGLVVTLSRLVFVSTQVAYLGCLLILLTSQLQSFWSLTSSMLVCPKAACGQLQTLIF